MEEICGRKLTLSKEGTFLNTAEIRHATSHILSGVAYLHSMGIVHRDIRGGNIYLVPQHDTVVDAPSTKRWGSEPIDKLYTEVR